MGRPLPFRIERERDCRPLSTIFENKSIGVSCPAPLPPFPHTQPSLLFTKNMPKSTRLGSTEHLFAIQSSTLLPTHSTSNSSKRFYIPKKLRFTLRFFQFIFACFDLFLLDLQDGKLVEGQELSAVVQMAKAVGGVSVGVLLWQGILYVVPM